MQYPLRCMLALLAAGWLAGGGVQASPPPPFSLWILQGAAHPALDETREGLLEELARAGYAEGRNLELRVHVVQGSPDMALSIVQKMFHSRRKPDVIVPIGTSVAQIVKRQMERADHPAIQSLFSSITDPLGAGLVTRMEAPGGSMSGVSNFVPLEPQVRMLKALLGKETLRLGVIMNPGEANSVSVVEQLKKVAPGEGITIITGAAPDTGKVAPAAMRLQKQGVDAVFLHNDNTVLSAAETLFRTLTLEGGIPVMASDNAFVARGALCALGPSQRDVGAQTARMILRVVLEGKNAGTLPVEQVTRTGLHLNLEAARRCGITIPEAVLHQAAQVVETTQP